MNDVRKIFAGFFGAAPKDGAGDALVTNPEANEERNPDGSKKIIGYRVLSDEDVTLINAIKTVGLDMRQVISTIELLNQVEAGQEQPYDPRWIGIARTHLQQGFMALTRAVAKPEGF
jgi:hypothetical protein